MSAKKVSISPKPNSKNQQLIADDWVENRRKETFPAEERMRRLTIDIPDNLHREIKSQCALRGSKIADEVRELLSQKYLNKEIKK